MYVNRTQRAITAGVIFVLLLGSGAAFAVSKTAQLQSKLKKAGAGVKDLTATMVVTEINKGNAADINPAFSEIGQFQKAKVYYKSPDKFRADGVAKGMTVAYATNGNKLQIVVPGLVKRVEDVSAKPGKQRVTLDMGFITDASWKNNNVTYLGSEGGVAKLNLDPKRDNTKRHELVWVDEKSLRLVKRQRYNSAGELRAKYIYGDFVTIGQLPIAREAKIYAPDGDFVGKVNYKDMKANTGLSDSLFTLIK